MDVAFFFFSGHLIDFHSASDEGEFEVMGMIALTDFEERDETILGLRVTICSSGDGGAIKLHYEF